MSTLKWLFVGPDGVRHGWRFLIFAAVIVLVVQFLEQPAIAFLAATLHVDRSVLSAPSIIVSDAFDLIVILIVTGVAARFEHRRIDSYGLPINEAFGGFFWNGAVAGLATIGFVGTGMLITGGMHVHGLALHGAEMITAPVLWMLAMLLVGLMEEYLFRGYALQSLWRGTGFWPAALIRALCRRPLVQAARKRNGYWNDLCPRRAPLYERSRHGFALVGGRLACRF
jgi:hypothetical protein